MRCVLIAVLAAAMGCASTPDRAEDERSDQAQEEVNRSRWVEAVHAARTMQQLSAVFRSAPISCVHSSLTEQLCEWRAEPGTAYLRTRTLMIPFPRRGAVALCTLPLDGSDRDPESCNVSFR